MFHKRKERFPTLIVAIVIAAAAANLLALNIVEDKSMLFLVSTFIIFASAVLIIFLIDGNAKFALKNFATKIEEELEANA